MIRRPVVVAILIVGFTLPVAAQRRAVNEDAAEIRRLQDSVYLVERDLSALSERACRCWDYNPVPSPSRSPHLPKPQGCGDIRCTVIVPVD